MIEKDYKIIVALYLRGDNLDPEFISNTIGIIPTKSQYKGKKSYFNKSRMLCKNWSMGSNCRPCLLQCCRPYKLASIPDGEMWKYATQHQWCR